MLNSLLVLLVFGLAFTCFVMCFAAYIEEDFDIYTPNKRIRVAPKVFGKRYEVLDKPFEENASELSSIARPNIIFENEEKLVGNPIPIGDCCESSCPPHETLCLFKGLRADDDGVDYADIH